MGVASAATLKFFKLQNVLTFAVHNGCGPHFQKKVFEELGAITLPLSISEKKFMVPSLIESE